jgi:putative transposase
MEEHRRGSYLVLKLHVHVVWYTKYRKEVLVKDVGYRVRERSRQICTDLVVEVLSGVVAKAHVHMLVSMARQISVSKLMQKVNMKPSTAS